MQGVQVHHLWLYNLAFVIEINYLFKYVPIYTSFRMSQLDNWNNTTSRLRKHQKSNHRINSMKSLINYFNSKSIDVVLEESRIKTLQQSYKQHFLNCSIIHRLIGIIIYLAKISKSFREHQEKSTSTSKELFSDFVIILKKYNVTLRNHLTHGKKNAPYVNSRI